MFSDHKPGLLLYDMYTGWHGMGISAHLVLD